MAENSEQPARAAATPTPPAGGRSARTTDRPKGSGHSPAARSASTPDTTPTPNDPTRDAPAPNGESKPKAKRRRRPKPRAGDGDPRASQPGGNANRGGKGNRGGGPRGPARRAQLIEARRAKAPKVTAASYPDLPVSERREELLELLAAHQVVVVAGETGSGKTTQLPKMLLELGRGIEGQIAHTQPRRIAARAVADRIAEELDTELGGAVGYAVRFDDTGGEDTLIRLVTDGLLLAEIRRDPLLQRYDTIVVDEAHERSLNIDFLLGCLHQILPKRPDLKLVITSATIDTERFAQHFAKPDGTPAPIVEVSGRTYPVEVRYQPPIDPETENQIEEPEAVAAAVEALLDEGKGDVLVFLSGEREIRDAEEVLAGRLKTRAELLPLYARLSAADQQRVFKPKGDKPRVVLATNVAETSLTVPGIRSVVDAGLARISRYSARLKVQRLPIEPVSQASANQRSGRCGRVAPGTCIRLYAEDDYNARPEFTDPEVLRTNLASVILRMASLGLGDVESFPFLEPPDRRQVRDGVTLLHELNAIESPSGELVLTDLGHKLARLPIDPRLGRMVLEADRRGCANEVIAIAAALSIQDPRERPAGKEPQAQQAHAQFAGDRSDFLTFLNLWRWIQTERRAQSGSQFRKACKANYLHVLRIREWQDLVGQLRRAAKEVGVMLPEGQTDPEPEEIHRALLSGLLSQLGIRDGDTREYLGARGSRFLIGRGSVVSKKQPNWVMAAELVETNRLWARTAAQVDPKDALALAEHLVRRSYDEPRWDRRRGEVVATERVTLYGLPIVAGRAVSYGRISPEEARELFIQKALVEQDWDAKHQFLQVNKDRIIEVERIEERMRRRGLLVGDAVLRAFFEERVPKEIVSGTEFERWWRRNRHTDPHLFEYPKDLLLDDDATRGLDPRDWPTKWRQGDLEMRLSYDYEPGSDRDGVTVHVPLEAIGQLQPIGFDWLVPGLREELVAGLLRGLPKETRRQLVPVPELAQQILRSVKPHSAPVAEAVAEQVLRLRGVRIDAAQLNGDALPGHLRMRFRIEDRQGKTLADDHDLVTLRQSLRPKLRERLSEAVAPVARSGLTEWPAVDSNGNIPKVVALPGTGQSVRAYPSLVDEDGAVGVRVVDTREAQAANMQAGTRRLLTLTLPDPTRAAVKQLGSRLQLVLAGAAWGGAPAVMEDAFGAAIDVLMAEGGGPVFEKTKFDQLSAHVAAGLVDRTAEIARGAAQVLIAAADVQSALDQAPIGGNVQEARDDINHQLGLLVHDGFVSATGAARLASVERYLRGMVERLQRLPLNPAVDRDRMHAIHTLEDELDGAATKLGDGVAWPPNLVEAFWLVQELRLLQLAPGARVEGGPSAKKVRKLIAG